MTTTEVAVAGSTQTKIVNVLPYQYWPMNERWGYARTLAHAGDMIPSGLRAGNDVEATAARVFLVLETGAMLGLHPMAAIQGIDVIKGTAAISPQTFSGLARNAGMKLRIQEVGTIEGGDFAVHVSLTRPDDDEPITASFSMKDALRAELVSKYEQKPGGGDYMIVASNDNWRKYPQDMCQWRAIGRLARRGAADVTMGIGYFPEELEVVVNEDGVRRDMGPAEDDLLAEIRDFDDKADMADIWRRHNRINADSGKIDSSDEWTTRVQAEFDAHLSTLTKDSRPPKEGAPGQTGLAAIDGKPAESPAVAAAARGAAAAEARSEVSVEASDNAERAQRGFTGGHPDAAAPEGAMTKSGPQLRELESDEERDARLDQENYQQYLAEQAREAVGEPTVPAPLDMSALEPKPEQ